MHWVVYIAVVVLGVPIALGIIACVVSGIIINEALLEADRR